MSRIGGVLSNNRKELAEAIVDTTNGKPRATMVLLKASAIFPEVFNGNSIEQNELILRMLLKNRRGEANILEGLEQAFDIALSVK